MVLGANRIAAREKLILTGLFLSKFDSTGLEKLGFESFVEAFNVIGYALGAKPASIKNYRDEFDPFFANPRKGWHKRSLREYCRVVMEKYGQLDLQIFSDMVKSFVGYDDNVWSSVEPPVETAHDGSAFAKRLITGVAAEHYFESVLPDLSEFQGYSVENTTRLGCGYDFRLKTDPAEPFLAVEVKGLQDRSGNISLTPKEYDIAGSMADRFYLFVVKNFRESPFHAIYQNPVAGKLKFFKSERVVVQISWTSTV